MRVYHLNCGTMHAIFPRRHGVCHCLLIETDDGLVLVDTGLGLRDYTNPAPFVRLFTASIGSPRDLEETAARQVVRLGFATEDVRHIVLTHLHLDHTGGLPDFPRAKAHVFAPEYEAAMNPRRFSIMERAYVATHWAHGPKWVNHSLGGRRWFGLDCMQVIKGISFKVLLIPLTGHSRGHCGVAVETPDGWLLHCGDAYMSHSEVDPDHPHSPLPGWMARRLLPHVPRLRALVHDHGDKVQLFCAHDPFEFSKFQNPPRA
jgi:glyoxylase-like metal-dependent hydrolase (beta-lactamase superfamily II)